MSLFQPAQQQQQKSQQNAFAQKGPQQQQEALSYLSSQLNNFSTRLRMVEERFNNSRNKMEVDEQNTLNFHKKINTEFKTLNSELTELKNMFKDMKGQVSLIIKELQLSAKKEDVKVLEKYIEIWQPLNFVTRKEVDRIIHEILDEQNKKFINV